ADPPIYAHVPDVLGTDGKKLSKRHGAQSVEDFREQGYIPEALVNFLARLGWAYDDKTEVFNVEELLRLFRLERVSPSPAVFDYQKLEWLNGMHLRMLSPEEYADRVVTYLREQGIEWDEQLVRKAAPLVQEKIAAVGEFADYTRCPSEDGPADSALLDGRADVLAAAEDVLARAEPFDAETIERELRALGERLSLQPRGAVHHSRIA